MLRAAINIIYARRKSFFQERYSFEQRITMSERLQKCFPERIPVILEPINYSPAGNSFPNSKYAVPQQYFISSLAEIITGKLGRKAKLYIRLENYPSNWSNWLLSYIYDTTLVEAPINITLIDIYNDYKHQDGLLYIAYTTENN